MKVGVFRQWLLDDSRGTRINVQDHRVSGG